MRRHKNQRVYTNDVFISLKLTFSLVVGSGDNGGSRMGVGGRGRGTID